MSSPTYYPRCERCNRLLAGSDNFRKVAKDIVQSTPHGQPLQMTIFPSRPTPAADHPLVRHNQAVPGRLCHDCKKEMAGSVSWTKKFAYAVGTIGLWAKGELPKSQPKPKADKKTDDKKKEKMEDWVIIN